MRRQPAPFLDRKTTADVHRQAAFVFYGVCVRLSRVRVKNFRNLVHIDVPLAQHTVIVGENRSGKSNLLHAMRLVLDNTLSADQRRLPLEDFWEGLTTATSDPVGNGDVIEVSLDVTDSRTRHLSWLPCVMRW